MIETEFKETLLRLPCNCEALAKPCMRCKVLAVIDQEDPSLTWLQRMKRWLRLT